jgi:type II secretory pathway predicted ATPase ExeA
MRAMYTRFYGLSKKPFENTPDPGFLYLSKRHREVLASILYGIDSGKGFVLVVGDVGTGKTTLIYAALREISQSHLVLHIINPRTTFNEITRHLAKKLGIEFREMSTIDFLDALKDKFLQLEEQGRKVVLIIDEAHHLSDESLEEIRLLSNIETETRKLIQIVLVGQKELLKTLMKDSLRQLRQRITIHRVLEPIDRRETIEYITHRLRVAGQGSPLFDNKALELIWRESRGIPRLVNQVCDNALLTGFAQGARPIDLRVIREVVQDMRTALPDREPPAPLVGRGFRWLAASAIAVVAVAVLLYHNESPWKLLKRDTLLRRSVPDPMLVRPLAPEQTSASDGITTAEPVPVAPSRSSPPEVSDGNPGEAVLDVQKAPLSSQPTMDMEEPPYLPVQTTVHPRDVSSEKENGGDSHKVESGDEAPVSIAATVSHFGVQPVAQVFSPAVTNVKSQEDVQRHVHPKESLLKIAKETYGVANDTILDIIHMANPNLKHLNLIHPGQKLALPVIEKENLIIKNENNQYYIYYQAYYDYARSHLSRNDLSKGNVKAFVIPAIQGSEMVYRIYLGVFKSHEDALKVLDTLNLKHMGNFGKDAKGKDRSDAWRNNQNPG